MSNNLYYFYRNFEAEMKNLDFYSIGMKELQEGIYDEEIYAKSLVKAEGDTKKAKATYIDLRARQILYWYEKDLEEKNIKTKKEEEVRRKEDELNQERSKEIDEMGRTLKSSSYLYYYLMLNVPVMLSVILFIITQFDFSNSSVFAGFFKFILLSIILIMQTYVVHFVSAYIVFFTSAVADYKYKINSDYFLYTEIVDSHRKPFVFFSFVVVFLYYLFL